MNRAMSIYIIKELRISEHSKGTKVQRYKGKKVQRDMKGILKAYEILNY